MEIKRSYNLMGVAKFEYRIADGVAILKTIPDINEHIYKQAMKGGKLLRWDRRLNVLIEKFPEVKAEEIARRLDIDMNTAKDEGEKARRLALDKLKTNKK